MTRPAVLCLLIATAAFAQDTITRSQAAIGLGRLSTKISAGPLGSLDTTTDSFSASFAKTTLTITTPTDVPGFTTIGNCIIIQIQPPSGTPLTATNSFLDA